MIDMLSIPSLPPPPSSTARIIGDHHWMCGVDYLNRHPGDNAVRVMKVNDWEYILKRDRSDSFVQETRLRGDTICEELLVV
jgi:hypothetical protein